MSHVIQQNSRTKQGERMQKAFSTPIMCQVIYHRDRDRSVSQPNHNHQTQTRSGCLDGTTNYSSHVGFLPEMHHFELIVFSPIHPWWMYDTDTGQEIWFSLWNHTFFSYFGQGSQLEIEPSKRLLLSLSWSNWFGQGRFRRKSRWYSSLPTLKPLQG